MLHHPPPAAGAGPRQGWGSPGNPPGPAHGSHRARELLCRRTLPLWHGQRRHPPTSRTATASAAGTGGDSHQLARTQGSGFPRQPRSRSPEERPRHPWGGNHGPVQERQSGRTVPPSCRPPRPARTARGQRVPSGRGSGRAGSTCSGGQGCQDDGCSLFLCTSALSIPHSTFAVNHFLFRLTAEGL